MSMIYDTTEIPVYQTSPKPPCCLVCRWWGEEAGDKRLCGNPAMKAVIGVGVVDVGNWDGENVLATPPEFGCVYYEAHD